MSLNGEVASAIAGVDAEWGRWLAGVALSYSEGAGAYTQPAARGGAVSSTLVSVNPYAHFRLGERASLWATLGRGSGRMSLTPEGSESPLETDLDNTMAAFGGRGVLAVRAGATGQFELAVRSDAMLTDTTSEAVLGLAGGEGATSRIRLTLEGTGALRAFGGTLSPRLEAGLRYDGGDAETGAGLELGGGLRYGAGRLALQADGRMLVAHQDQDYGEWGYSASIAYEPGADGRGLRLRTGSAWGATQSGVASLWSMADARGLARRGAVDNAQRFTSEVGYGFGSRRLWYPYLAAEGAGDSAPSLRFGLRLDAGSNLAAELEIARRENAPGQIDSGVLLQLRGRW